MRQLATDYSAQLLRERTSRAQLKGVVTLFLAAGAFVLCVFASNLMCDSAVGLKTSVLRTMHLSHNDPMDSTGHGSRIRSWFALDMIMQPSTEHRDVYFANVMGNTNDGELSTAASRWQMADACPMPSTPVTAWEQQGHVANLATQEAAFFCDAEKEDQTNCPLQVETRTVYPNPLMYFICRINRVPSLGIYESDPNSFSFSSGHSPVTLVFFMQIVTLLIAVYETIRMWNFYMMDHVKGVADASNPSMVQQAKTTANHQRAQTGVSMLCFAIFVAALWIFLVRFLTVSLENLTLGRDSEEGDTYNDLRHRPLPNGSFLYGLAAFILISFVTVSRLRRFFEPAYGEHQESEELKDDDMEEVPASQAMLVVLAPGADEAPAATGTNTPNKSEGMQMSVLGFVGSKKIPLAAYQVDKMHFSNGKVGPTQPGAPSLNYDITTILAAPRFKQSTWSIAQLCLLPLWLFTAISVSVGFELDVDTQVVLVAAFVLCIADVYLDRFITIAHTCQLLQKDMLHGVQVWVAGLIIVVQVFLVLIINYCTGWRSSQYVLQGSTMTMHTTDAAFGSDDARSASTTGIVLFNIYFALTALLKLMRVYYHQKPPSASSPSSRWFSIRTLDEFLLGTLILSVFIYSAVILVNANTSTSWFESVHTTLGGADGLSAEEQQVLFWRSNWVSTRAFGAA